MGALKEKKEWKIKYQSGREECINSWNLRKKIKSEMYGRGRENKESSRIQLN